MLVVVDDAAIERKCQALVKKTPGSGLAVVGGLWTKIGENEMQADIIKPIAALASWTMVMWVWMYATRIPAILRSKVDSDALVKSGVKSLDGVLPPEVQWKAHNYNHLHEAPTVFYAVALALAFLGAGNGVNATLGWVYVGLRIVHSLIQATVNKVVVRFAVFSLSSFVLIALVLQTVLVAFR